MPPTKGNGVRRAPAVGMKQRNGMQLYASSASVRNVTQTERHEINIAVREHHSLGIGTRAAGVEEFSQGVFVDAHNVRAVGRLPRPERLHSSSAKAREPAVRRRA